MVCQLWDEVGRIAEWIVYYFEARISLLHRKQRLFSGFVSAVTAGFLTFAYLEPLFVPVGSEVAMVFLYMLSINGAMVGMSLGVLLPMLFPGLCAGASLALFICCCFSVMLKSFYFFPLTAGVLAAIGGAASASAR